MPARPATGKTTVCVLGSGSRGNAIYVSDGATSILVDAGFSAREIDRRLRSRGIDPAGLKAILITHEHTDHVKGVERLVRRHRLPVYLTAGTGRAVDPRRRPPGRAPVRLRPRIPHRHPDGAPLLHLARRRRSRRVHDQRQRQPDRDRHRPGPVHGAGPGAPARLPGADPRIQPRPGHADERPLPLVPEAAHPRPHRPPVEPGIRPAAVRSSCTRAWSTSSSPI